MQVNKKYLIAYVKGTRYVEMKQNEYIQYIIKCKVANAYTCKY